MSKKAKLKPVAITSREQMEAVVAEAVAYRLEHAELHARMEQEIAAIQKDYQEDLLGLQKEVETREEGVYLYCQGHRSELFPDERKRKSIETPLAIMGFRINPFRVEKTRSKDTWSKIALRLCGLVWGEKYVREKDPEVNKDALLADRTQFSAKQLSAAGIKFEQDEEFYITPKSDLAAATVKEAA